MKILILFLLSFNALAVSPSLSRKQFCQDRVNPNFVKELTRSEANLMAFENRGGISNGGVCWWHSRFQRNALYLTYFTPDAPRPTKAEARQLIRDIRHYNGVFEIKGFNNFNEFSNFFEPEIQAELEKWQRFEGARFTWIRGLRGSSSVNPSFLNQLMDSLYEEVEIKNMIAYQKLQMKGIVAHAWLVVGMKKDDKGYDLEVVDSLFPNRTMSYRYNIGDRNFTHEIGEVFVPYLEYSNEAADMTKFIQEYCLSELAAE